MRPSRMSGSNGGVVHAPRRRRTARRSGRRSGRSARRRAPPAARRRPAGCRPSARSPRCRRRRDPLDDPARRALEIGRIAVAGRDRRDPQPVEELVEQGLVRASGERSGPPGRHDCLDGRGSGEPGCVLQLRLTFDDGPDPGLDPADPRRPSRRGAARDVLRHRPARAGPPDPRPARAGRGPRRTAALRRPRPPHRPVRGRGPHRHAARARAARRPRCRRDQLAHAVGRARPVDGGGRARARPRAVRMGRRHPRLGAATAPRRCSPPRALSCATTRSFSSTTASAPARSARTATRRCATSAARRLGDRMTATLAPAALDPALALIAAGAGPRWARSPAFADSDRTTPTSTAG